MAGPAAGGGLGGMKAARLVHFHTHSVDKIVAKYSKMHPSH